MPALAVERRRVVGPTAHKNTQNCNANTLLRDYTYRNHDHWPPGRIIREEDEKKKRRRRKERGKKRACPWHGRALARGHGYCNTKGSLGVLIGLKTWDYSAE